MMKYKDAPKIVIYLLSKVTRSFVESGFISASIVMIAYHFHNNIFPLMITPNVKSS